MRAYRSVIPTSTVARTACGAIVVLLGAATPALAIPSPELVVGSLSSLSQVVALVSAMLGGGALLAGARASTRPVASRRLQLFGIGAGVCLVLSLGVNAYQYASQKADRRAMLEATLKRPTQKVDGKTLDPMLVEPSYKDLVAGANGISTDGLEQTLTEFQRGERKDVVFLDIREHAETEMGGLPGSINIRAPDLDTAKLKSQLAGKTAILICHNGFRSYQNCQALAKLGIDCRYIVGGLEKWLVEGRPLTGLRARTLDDLRAIPSYPNQTVLLDTPEVHDLVEKQGAIFVDVRYPGEFATFHLPGAINLPLRPTPTETLRTSIAALPQQPIILPCYDRRSCFFAEALGLEISRAGHQVVGRYTVPWDYFVTEPPRPYIKQWLEMSRQGWWDKLVVLIAGAIESSANHIGLLLSIVLLAAASRALVFPVSLKTERDQIRSRALADEVDDIKARLKGDPRRFAREMRAFYRRNGLTPIRNLLALLFLPLMAISVAAVQKAAALQSVPLLWVRDAAAPDPTLVLPLVFAALICGYLDLVFGETRLRRLLIWGLGIPLLGVTGALLSAAADIYLITSAVLLTVQRLFVAGTVSAAIAATTKRWRRGTVVPLAWADQLAGCGQKVYRLAQLRQHGIPVPDGVVLTSRFLTQFTAAAPTQRQQLLDQVWRKIGTGRVVVRSSAAAEDGSTHSFAGIFESVLDVDRAGLEAAITAVLSSFGAERAQIYGVGGDAANILVQRMVNADYSGVMFTRDPAAAGLALIEMVEGLADKLVSGSVAPQAFRFGRISGEHVDTAAPPIDLSPLVALGRQVEQIFGRPQDIEWVFAGGRFQIVQSRDITRMVGDENSGAVDAEWSRILDRAARAPAGAVVFAQNEMAEVLPHPTPLSLSLMESLWASGGSVDLACRTLGLAYQVDESSPSYLVTIFGRLYADKTEEHARALKLNALAKRRLIKGAAEIERRFRDEFLPQFLTEVALLDATDFDRLPTAELMRLLGKVRTDFVTGTHAEVDIINVAAEFYLQQAKAQLDAAGLEPTKYLVPGHDTVFSRAIIDAEQGAEPQRRTLLTERLGHRAVLDYELAAPRYAENPQSLDAFATLAMVPAQADALDRDLAPVPGLHEAVQRVRRFQVLKEDAKHYSLRQLAVLRRLALAIGRRFDLGALAFYLTFEEMESLIIRPLESLRTAAADRQAIAAAFADLPALGSVLTVRQLESASAGLSAEADSDDGSVVGKRVSGSGIVEGRACVVAPQDAENGATIPRFEDGDIVISTMVRPDWIPYFRRAGGFVCEVGGWLSHTAILARECNVPMVVGTRGIRRIADGMRLRLHPDGRVELLDVEVSIAAE